jgi:endonuclease/exonuclease/phosphatase family metal-dependent hydrolase
MESIGVSCDWELHKQIAKVNGITDFTGTAAQNTELLNLLKKGKLINPKAEESGTSSNTGTASKPETPNNNNSDSSKVVLENIVVGINERYIGNKCKELVKAEFSEYLAKTQYKFNVEYRTLGNSETTVDQLGALINSSKDIDFVLAAGANITTKGGVDVVIKAKMLDEYNVDGKRYGALISESMSAALFYEFVTGEHYHYYDNDSDSNCNICGENRHGSYTNVVLENGVNVKYIKGHDSSASNKPVISGGNSVVFTADTDGKDEVWEIDLGGERLDPNTRYTVQLSLKNSVGNVGVGCVRDEYISEIYGVNTFYGNFADKKVGATDGYKLRVRRGFYEISDITKGTRKTFPYAEASVDADGYVKIKLDVAYNGTTYVSSMYYLNKSSEWVKFDEAYVGVSSSNTFGLYVLHGSTSKCVAAIKDVKYSIEANNTSYSEDVTTPTIKLIDYNVQTGNSYYTMTANWLKSQSPDIIGLQEVGPNWYKYLKNLLGDKYGYIGTPRSGTSSTSGGNEASPIFYKKSEYKLIDSGTKWLSSTPDKVGSRISGSEYIRVMTYAVLYHKDTGTIYIYVNTHLDNASAGSVRVKQIDILMNLVDKLPNYPTILTGDLNGGLNSQVITKIQNSYGYTNLAKKAAVKNSTYKTNTFWETSSPTVLDYIFLSDMGKFNALSYTVGNNSSRCSVYKYSDHYSLISTFTLK